MKKYFFPSSNLTFRIYFAKFYIALVQSRKARFLLGRLYSFQALSAKSQNRNYWRQRGHRWMCQSSRVLPQSIHLPKFLLVPQTPNLLTLEPAQFSCSSFDNSRTVLDILSGMFSGLFVMDLAVFLYCREVFCNIFIMIWIIIFK